MSEQDMPQEPASGAPPAVPARSPWRRRLAALASLALVAGLLVGVLPAMADLGEVWAAVQSLTWLETSSLFGLAGWNILTYLLVFVAALPGLTLLQAFVAGQVSTAITNTLPGGSAIGVGVTYAMFSSFGFGTGSIAIASVVTGLWNTFVKLGLPVVALALLTFRGGTNPALVSAAITGLTILVGAVGLIALIMASERAAHSAGEWLCRATSRMARIIRRGPFSGWGDGLVRFRSQSIDLLRRRWHLITLATVTSHLSLFAMLLVALRHMGVSGDAVTITEALAAFAIVRLVTAIPITPGNLGVVEVGLSAALVVAGGEESLVVAAVLIYRALSYLLQVPLGLVGYLIWRAKKSWRVAEAPQEV